MEKLLNEKKHTCDIIGFCEFVCFQQYWSFILEHKNVMLSSFQVCIQSRDYIFKHKNEGKPRRKWVAGNTMCSNAI